MNQTFRHFAETLGYGQRQLTRNSLFHSFTNPKWGRDLLVIAEPER